MYCMLEHTKRQVIKSFFFPEMRLIYFPAFIIAVCFFFCSYAKMAKKTKVSIRFCSFIIKNSWFAITCQGGHVGGQYNRIFCRRTYMKREFGSQRREMLLFFTTNMAAVTSRVNQQY